MGEMMRFAIELRQVGRYRVDQVADFVLALAPFQERAVVGEGLQAERPQAPRQASIDHLPLVIAQHDPGALPHDRGELLEVPVRQGELATTAGNRCRGGHLGRFLMFLGLSLRVGRLAVL